MFCQKCGRKNDDHSRFCSQCGAPLIPPFQASANAQYVSRSQIPASQTPTNPQYIPQSQMPKNPSKAPAQQSVPQSQPVSRKSKKRTLLLILSVVVVLLLAAAAAWFFLLRPSGEEKALQIEAITLDMDTVSLSVGETYKVEYTLSPKDAEDDLEWESDDESVATVSRKGVVTAVSDGSCSIFVRSESGAVAVLEVYVNFSSGGSTTYSPEDEPTPDTTPEPEPDTEAPDPSVDYSQWKVAMITDYGDVTDQSLNQITYEAGKAWCEARGVDFTYYKPTGDTTAERVTSVEQAIDDGYNVLLLPGFVFGDTIVETAGDNPDVTFIALDVSEGDFYVYGGYEIPNNVFCSVYREEISGYMAGYAAVKLGYKKLAFLGGMAVPAVVRYGYGFVQGANDAALELGIENKVVIDYMYGNQFFGDAEITAYMDTIYANGCEVCFSCGGGIYASAVEAALKVGGKVIGVDVDQSGVIAAGWEGAEDLTVTSAMKGLGETVSYMLSELIENDNWYRYGGKVITLGLESATDTSLHFVRLPDSTQWAPSFTKDDYLTLVFELYWGERYVSNDTESFPDVSITVNYFGSIK